MGAIYLVRHGQASFGAVNYDALSERGVRQARVVGEALRSRLPAIDRVIAGTMHRHLDTARGCLEGLGASLPIEQDAAWNEFDHDELLVRHEPAFADRVVMYQRIAEAEDPRATFERHFREAIMRWMSGAHDAEYNESWTQFRDRCVGALGALVQTLGASKTALVFTSGGPISQISAHRLGLSPAAGMMLPATLANCGVTKIVYGSRGAFVSTLNEHGWFEGTNRELLTYR